MSIGITGRAATSAAASTSTDRRRGTALEGGRLTRTLLFSDIEGSSQLEQRIGTARYAIVRRRHRELLRAAFRAQGGVEYGTEGDSFFVIFESAASAVAAAVEAQRAANAEPWPEDGIVRVRIGLHTGEIAVIDGDPVGIAINRAARIASATHGGQIVVSEATRTLADTPGGQIGFRDLGLHRLKDFEPMRLFQVDVPGLPAEFPALRSAGSAFGGLPIQATSFVGRAEQVEVVRALLADHRLVTLTGPGGTGKTRLSLAAADVAAHQFADGTAWVGLSPIDDPALVPAAFASVLGVVDEGTSDLADAIAERIADASLLLVVDNFEQVLPATPLVSKLLAACPRLTTLVTSRGPLHLAGEQEYPVPPLVLPDSDDGPQDVDALLHNEAIALFVERGRAVRPDFALTAETAPAIVAICARLEGLPLAIELAAARLRVLSPSAIQERLDHSLGLLTGGAADLPDRQRTLRGAVAWSHDLLDAPARALFARLSVFAGGWSFEAAEAVCDPIGDLGVDLLDGLQSLVDQGLVRVVDVASGEARFRMLHVIREFGLEQLAAIGQIDATRQGHLAFFADMAASAEDELVGTQAGRWLDRLELEQDNIRTALRWAIESGDVQRGLAMAGQLWRFWHQRGHLGEALAITRDLLACPEANAPTRARAKALNGAGGLSYWRNDFAAAAGYYREQLELVRTLGDQRGIAEALLNLGFIAAIAGDYEVAMARYEESGRVAADNADVAGESAAQLGLAMVDSLTSDLEGSWRAAMRARDLGISAGERFWVNSANGVLGRVATIRGDLDLGAKLTGEAMRGFASVGDSLSTAMEVWDFAEIALRSGRPERALVLAAASERVRERLAGGAPTALSRTMDVMSGAKPQVGAARAAELMAIGRGLSLDQAVAFADSSDELPAAGAGSG